MMKYQEVILHAPKGYYAVGKKVTPKNVVIHFQKRRIPSMNIFLKKEKKIVKFPTPKGMELEKAFYGFGDESRNRFRLKFKGVV
jgi:hypothetical protein